MTLDQWLAEGTSRGFCSAVFCGMHDIGPMTDTEKQAWEDDGLDVCLPFIRIWGEHHG